MIGGFERHDAGLFILVDNVHAAHVDVRVRQPSRQLGQGSGVFLEADQQVPGSGGNVTLWAGDEQIGQGRMDRSVPIAFSSYAGMDVGRDNGLVVDLDYEDRAPYAFTGTIERVVFDLQPVSHEEATSLHEHHAHQSVGHGAAG